MSVPCWQEALGGEEGGGGGGGGGLTQAFVWGGKSPVGSTGLYGEVFIEAAGVEVHLQALRQTLVSKWHMVPAILYADQLLHQ